MFVKTLTNVEASAELLIRYRLTGVGAVTNEVRAPNWRHGGGDTCRDSCR